MPLALYFGAMQSKNTYSIKIYLIIEQILALNNHFTSSSSEVLACEWGRG